jgi:hypothetical protein
VIAIFLAILIPRAYLDKNDDVTMVHGQGTTLNDSLSSLPPSFYKGNATVVILIPNAYNATEWENVDNYTSKGFTIRSIVPTSELLPDPDNPNRIFVILERS